MIVGRVKLPNAGSSVTLILFAKIMTKCFDELALKSAEGEM